MQIKIPQGFERAGQVIQDAVDQMASGKGVKRHGVRPDGTPIPFEQQQMLRNARICGPGGPANQVLKKTEEALLLFAQDHHAKAYVEILGGIIALAAMGDVVRPGACQQLDGRLAVGGVSATGSAAGDDSEERC